MSTSNLLVPVRIYNMANAYDAKSQSVGEFLGGSASRTKILVPEFQRGYMWLKDHVNAFWSDVIKNMESRALTANAPKHFFGPIVTLPDSTNTDHVHLLDGQQRLATVIILLSVMRDVSRTIGETLDAAKEFAATTQQFIAKEEGGFNLELGETDKRFYRDYIQKEMSDKPKPKLRTNRNIVNSRNYLSSHLSDLLKNKSDAESLAMLRQLRSTVLYDLVFANIPVTTEDSAFNIFETLNDRGLKLSASDLLLNHLMGKAKEEDRKEIRALWSEMLSAMGKYDIDKFLRHVWVSKYGDLKQTDLFSKLREYLKNENVYSLDFAKLCANECETYATLLNLSEEDLGESLPYVRAIVKDLGIKSAMPSLLVAYPLFKDRKDFADVAKYILVFFTRYSIIGDLDSSKVEDVLFSLARSMRASSEQATPPTFPEYKKTFRDTLSAITPDDEALKSRVGDLVLNVAESRYMVMRLARFIQDPSKEVTLGETNVEHIYPQHPKETEWGGIENQEIMEPFTWHLGNLTIMGRSKNRKVENFEYSIKKAYYTDNSKVKMTLDVAYNYNDWNVESIQKRAKSFSGKIIEIWNYENPSRV